jgi:hypothetical protein
VVHLPVLRERFRRLFAETGASAIVFPTTMIPPVPIGQDQDVTVNDKLVFSELVPSGDVAAILGDRKLRWLRNTMPALYAIAFVRKYFEQLRGTLCNGERRARVESESKFTLQGGAAAIAAWIVSEFGIAEPIGIGIATFLVLALMAAAGGAFCQMTKDDLLRALGDGDDLVS